MEDKILEVTVYGILSWPTLSAVIIKDEVEMKKKILGDQGVLILSCCGENGAYKNSGK